MKLYNEIKHNILSVKVDKRNDVYTAGIDNLFPNLVETLINISVTSKICVDKVAKSIYGKSFGKIGKTIVNKDGQTLNEVLRIASREYAKHNNLFIHVGYNLLFEITSIKVIPFTQVRIGKQDDLGYSGKYIIADWENKPKADSFKIYNRYNPIESVIQSQIENAGDIRNYKGQILHLSKYSNSVYSLTDLNTVLNEALSENNYQLFRVNGGEKGFQNTKLIVVQPFANDDDRRGFLNKLKDLEGAENSGNILLLESSNMTDDLGSQIKLDDLTSEFNDTLFEYSEAQSEKNICKAFGVPLMLVNSSDNGLFGNSGELIKQGKLQLWESREEERDQLEEVFQNLMKKFHKPIDSDLKIISPFEQITTESKPILNE
ncbi:hypothetical protein ACFSKN_04715 [Mariniflexile gromovii]|uniref:Phage portal protein n=1 Tax=Mariniflexile gromovii TaxID=362523 RepID=A0ABS4BW85_9FLAO|nr:hypothetical protein [Mariniflexile gromovii]MBP0904850.1 hypothetical protein [Mariniflexile gromovii]